MIASESRSARVTGLLSPLISLSGASRKCLMMAAPARDAASVSCDAARAKSPDLSLAEAVVCLGADKAVCFPATLIRFAPLDAAFGSGGDPHVTEIRVWATSSPLKKP